MRRSAAEKMEIIRLVEGTDLPVRATLRQLGVPKSTFYGWYQRYLEAGFDGLQDNQPVRRAGWNRIPRRIKDQVLALALDRTDLSPRELACRFTEEQRYFVSESSVGATPARRTTVTPDAIARNADIRFAMFLASRLPLQAPTRAQARAAMGHPLRSRSGRELDGGSARRR